MQIGRSVFLIVGLRGRALGEHFVNDLVWELLTGSCGWPARSPTATRASRCGRSRRWRPTSACSRCTGCPGAATGSTCSTPRSQGILTFGGPALFLLAQVFFLGGAVGQVPRSRPLGLAALAILAVATAPFSMLVGIAASGAVLVAVAISDTRGST